MTLTRRTPLRRTPFKPSTQPLRRAAMPRSAARARKAPRKTGPSKKVTDLVDERAAGRCESCGCSLAGVPASRHHRRPRRMGGDRRPETNLPSNLLVLCGSGTTGCHGWVESHRTQALLEGLLLPADAFPADTPVVYRTGELVLLGDDGSITLAPRRTP